MYTNAMIAVLLTATLAVSAGAQEKNGSIDETGTETVLCRSNWHGSQGSAEAECSNELDTKRSAAIQRLAMEGKRPIGGSNYPYACEEREATPNTFQHQCSGRSDVNWIRDEGTGALLAGLSKSMQLKSMVAPAAVERSAVVAALRDAVIVLDDELLKRFRAVFPGGYHTISLGGVSVLASDVSVGEKIASLPNTVTEDNYVAENRTDSPQSRKFRMSITTTESERYTFNRSLVRGSTSSASLGFNVQGVTGNVQAGTSRQLTIGSTTENFLSTQKAYEEQFEQNVRPRTVMFIKVKRETLHDTYALKGNVLFEGVVTVTYRKKDVYACPPFGTGRCVRWKTSTASYKLSQYLSDDQRKFDMAGVATISSSANTSTTITYAEKPIGELPAIAADPTDVAPPTPDVAEKNYVKVDEVPPGLVWRPVGTVVTCGFWIFRRAC